MKPSQTNSKWWLAAILLPVFAIVGGIFFAFGAPHNQSDWFGGAFLGRLFLGLLIGCMLSLVATVIRETFHGRRQHKYRIRFTMGENEVHLLHVRHGARLALGETASSQTPNDQD